MTFYQERGFHHVHPHESPPVAAPWCQPGYRLLVAFVVGLPPENGLFHGFRPCLCQGPIMPGLYVWPDLFLMILLYPGSARRLVTAYYFTWENPVRSQPLTEITAAIRTP
jgi:hypothetical protein